jgi:hypothetical protein
MTGTSDLSDAGKVGGATAREARPSAHGERWTLSYVLDRVGPLQRRVADLAAVAHKDVRDLCRDVPHIHQFLLSIQIVLLKDDFGSRLAEDADFASALGLIDEAADKISFVLHSLDTNVDTAALSAAAEHASTKLREGYAAARGALVRAIRSAPEAEEADWRRDALKIADEGADHFQSRAAVEEILKARDAARSAAGEIGSLKLYSYFEGYALTERRAADQLRAAAAALTLLLTTGLTILLFTTHVTLDPASELMRLSLALPLAGLAGYLARESTRHRRNATWADRMSIKLRTLPAFSEGDDSGRAGAYWRALGACLFGAQDDGKTTASDQSGDNAGLYDDLFTAAELLTGAVEPLRRLRKPGTPN